MNRLTPFLFGILLIVLMCAPYAYAETIPSTPTTETTDPVITYVAESGYVGPAYGSSVPAACQGAVAYRNSQTAYCGTLSYTSFTDQSSPAGSMQTGLCIGTRSNCSGEVTAASWNRSSTQCPEGYTSSNSQCTRTVYTCPSGYVLSADQQSCTKAECPAGVVASKGVFFGQTVTSPACLNGCIATYSGQQPWDSASGWIYIGQYTNTGQTCAESTSPPTSDVPAPTPPESTDPPTTSEYDCIAKGMSYGQVNGHTVCVPSGTPGTPPMIEPPSTSTEENPDGTTEEIITQDSQNGTNITRQTTTIVRDEEGNIISEQTTSTTASAPAFCEQNPDAAICSESKTSGGGSCETPPASEGDAIQSAILMQAWHTRCESRKTNTALGEGSELALELAQVGEDAMNGEDFVRGDITETLDVSGQISQEKFLSSGSIPDKVITGLPMGKTLTIPFSLINPYIEYFGMAMIALAMLGAARITGVF